MKISSTRKEGDFYIARVGSKAGFPMWDNYASNNAFTIYSDDPDHDFQLALHLYKSGKLDAYTLGASQPSIRKRDIERLLKSHTVSDTTLKRMKAVDDLIRIKELEISRLKELQSAIARIL